MIDVERLNTECWYRTAECPEDPVFAPLWYALNKFAWGTEKYEVFQPLEEDPNAHTSKRWKSYPDGSHDYITWEFVIDENTGEKLFRFYKEPNNLKEVYCMGLVDDSLMKVPNIDWRGYDYEKSYNKETWCEPAIPGPGDLAIYINTEDGSLGHVEFVYTTPTMGADGLWHFKAFGAMSRKRGQVFA